VRVGECELEATDRLVNALQSTAGRLHDLATARALLAKRYLDTWTGARKMHFDEEFNRQQRLVAEQISRLRTLAARVHEGIEDVARHP
jgi:uncharacterized protein YukE